MTSLKFEKRFCGLRNLYATELHDDSLSLQICCPANIVTYKAYAVIPDERLLWLFTIYSDINSRMNYAFSEPFA
jgi:hypothetical protein